jgi:hypothetical protein
MTNDYSTVDYRTVQRPDMAYANCQRNIHSFLYSNELCSRIPPYSWIACDQNDQNESLTRYDYTLQQIYIITRNRCPS